MIKLLDILKEIHIDEGIVKVPQKVLSKIKDVYDYISKNLENLKSKSEGKNWDNPYIDSKFKDYFQLKDLKGQDLKVTIGFYNNSKDAGAGRMDTTKDILLINLPFFTDVEEFEDLIEHELVHAMDPKVRDVKIFGKMYAKKGAEPGEFEKYAKSPWEFDAFTAPLVNKLVLNLKKVPNFKNTLIQLLSDIRSRSINDIVNDEKYGQLSYLFSKKEWTEENYPKIFEEYMFELQKMKTWATKPTLYKRFTSRLGKELS